MQGNRLLLDKIFGYSNEIIIPFFQRKYVWNKEYWERFYDDIKELNKKRKTHFMGVLVLKQINLQQPAGSKIKDYRLLIDGQQRLTTICLFFKALKDIKTNYSRDFDRIFINANDRICLTHNIFDKPVFDKIMENDFNIKTIEIIENDENKNIKNSNIYKCYKYFYDTILNEIDEIDFSEIIQDINFISVDLVQEEDEQEIFDSMNSLGIDLTPTELLKNYLFKTENDKDMYEEYWKKIIENPENEEYWNSINFFTK